jgi:hypothetical protein
MQKLYVILYPHSLDVDTPPNYCYVFDPVNDHFPGRMPWIVVVTLRVGSELVVPFDDNGWVRLMNSGPDLGNFHSWTELEFIEDQDPATLAALPGSGLEVKAGRVLHHGEGVLEICVHNHGDLAVEFGTGDRVAQLFEEKTHKIGTVCMYLGCGLHMGCASA